MFFKMLYVLLCSIALIKEMYFGILTQCKCRQKNTTILSQWLLFHSKSDTVKWSVTCGISISKVNLQFHCNVFYQFLFIQGNKRAEDALRFFSILLKITFKLIRMHLHLHAEENKTKQKRLSTDTLEAQQSWAMPTFLAYWNKARHLLL